MKIVAVSSYFNPLHVGHLRYINEAAKKGKVVAIVNSDFQVKLKGSVPFMEEHERLEIVNSLGNIYGAILSIDKGRSVCETLRMIKPDIYCVGADHYKKEKLPEAKVCKELGIKLLYGVGGRKKIQSSSKLLKKCKKYF